MMLHNPWLAASCAACNYGPCEFSPKSDIDDTTDRDTERRTYKIDWTPMGSFVPQCGDKGIKTLEPNTGNINININHL